jgi:hypothetical protein
MMKKATRWLVVTGIAALAVAITVSAAFAFGPRIPQVFVADPSLQNYLNANDGGINVHADQVDAQVWKSSVSGNATFTLMIELAGFAPNNDIGIYNSLDPPNPPKFLVFPGAAQAGWFATCHFGPGGALAVLLYDQNAVFQGQNNYAGVNRNSFGFYLDGPGGTFYSQDARNAGGNAQMLTYLGTDANFGDWWECFEDLSVASGSDSDFDDAILLLQSIAPTPTHGTSWGKLKSLYR